MDLEQQEQIIVPRGALESPARLGFHARDGWCFKRLPDGSVRIAKAWTHTAVTFAILTEWITLDPDTWASIVAAVSAGGEDAERWRQARAFHQGETGA